MGMVTISIVGSFGAKPPESFSAMEGGHALALARAIEYLARQLPAAIRLDHHLHAGGARPPSGDFGELPASSAG